MKTTNVLYALLAAPAIAQPHAGHGHGRFHKKRDLVTEYETEYVTEYVTEYIDETTTVFFYPDATTESTEASSSSTGVAGQFFEGDTTTIAGVPVETPTPVEVSTPPATTLIPVAPETTTSEEPVYTPPPVEVSTPTPTPTTEAAAPTTTSSADTGGGNSSGQTYSGDMTYYTVGMGACGENDTGKDDSENIVALSHELMGTQSNGNPYCGRTITISYNGKTTTAICRDKCMGCGIDEIDVSTKAFLEIFGDLGVGRHTVDWWFSD